ncbi:MAG: hypothetical protein HYT63_02010 [Candidatus Yanofskybacteria bacterium]|nr:hypothetical protein [Candidatus Yanofskybacteria bacterium]
MITLVVVILILILLFVLYFLVKKYMTEKSRLESLHMENDDSLKICQALIERIEKTLPTATKRLETIRDRIPKDQFLSLKNLVNTADKNLSNRKVSLAAATTVHLESGWKTAELVYYSTKVLLELLRPESQFSEVIDRKITELREAENGSQKLLTELPKIMESANKELQHPDVSKEAKDYLEKAKVEFEKAKFMVRDIKSSWLTIFASLSAITTIISTAREKGALDVNNAELAKAVGPLNLPQTNSSSPEI